MDIIRFTFQRIYSRKFSSKFKYALSILACHISRKLKVMPQRIEEE